MFKEQAEDDYYWMRKMLKDAAVFSHHQKDSKNLAILDFTSIINIKKQFSAVLQLIHLKHN